MDNNNFVMRETVDRFLGEDTLHFPIFECVGLKGESTVHFIKMIFSVF